jgi:predicted RNA-binding protein YlxR (DUF448 family)
MLAIADDQDLDAGPRKVAPGTERYCAATGTVKPVADMIRFVVGPDGAAVPDLKRRLPGRGLWVTATRKALALAIARKAFARGFRREVLAGPELVGATERLLQRSALDALSMAHKAKRVVVGFTKVENAILHDRVIGLLHAADAAPDGVRKLDAALQRFFGDKVEGIGVFNAFTTEQLDLALGRANVVHAALLASPESKTFVARAKLFDHFRTGDGDVGTGRTASGRPAKE